MCNINNPKFLCRICAKNVPDKDKAVQLIECCSTIFPLKSLLSKKKMSWPVILALIVISDSGKILKTIIATHYH